MKPSDIQSMPLPNVTELPRAPTRPSTNPKSAFTPILLMGIAFVAWLAFQAWQQVADRAQLAALDAALVPQEQSATKVRHALEAVATATAALANQGDDNARTVVEQLRKRGVTIDAPGAAKTP